MKNPVQLPSTHTALLAAFRSYLANLGLSSISRKLYSADIARLLASSLFSDLSVSNLTNPKNYATYLSQPDLASSSTLLRRTLASLRQFGTFLNQSFDLPSPINNLSLASNTLSAPISTSSNKYIKACMEYLKENHLTDSSIRSYKSDITQYLTYLESHHPSTRIESLLTDKNLQNYTDLLTHLDTQSPATIERKLKTIKRFTNWYNQSKVQILVSDNKKIPASTPSDLPMSAIVPPIEVSDFTRNTEPNQYSAHTPDMHNNFVKNNNYRKFRLPTLRSVLSFVILLTLISTLSIFTYRQFGREATLTAAFPSTPVTPNRQLSFQGRLENASGTPITAATNFVFKLHDASSGGSELYSSGTCSITPDTDGVFSTQIGGTCGSGIASSVFTENQDVWLEVTVGAETLTPRQQIATVAYALNSETIQGFPISATVSAIRNTVVPMNQWGEIIVGEQSPRLTGVSGTFQISAPSLSLVTATGTNGNITLAPDGTGQVNINGNTTTTNFFNVSNAQLTTGSLITGTAANNNSGFYLINLLSGSSPTSKFSVNNAGDIITAGDLTLSGGNLNTGNIGLTIGDGLTDSVTFSTDGTGNGEIILPNDSIGPDEILAAGQVDEHCLKYESTGDTWAWGTCGTGGGGTMSNFIAAGDSGGGQTITDTNTLSILGGTNGIDTIDSVTDTITLNLDTTEIGDSTFGAGAGITWNFDASGGTDTSIAFGNNTQTYTTGTATFTGGLTVNGNTTLGNAITDSIDFQGRVLQDSDLIPITSTGTNDLGSSTLPWDNLYLANLAFPAAGTLTLTDNTASALRIVEGANVYLDITTTDNSETFSLNLPTGGATLHTANLFTSSIAQTINIGTGTAADTINIGTGGTTADDINLGGLSTSHVDITGVTNFAGGTTYYVDATGNAKFLDLQVADTGNAGLTVGNGSTGFAKVGSLTIGDNNASVITFDANSDSTPDFQLYDTGSATASGDITMGGQLQVGRFSSNPTAIGAGTMIFDTTLNVFKCYNGTSWFNCGGTLFSNTNASVADGSYITVTHNLSSNDLLSSAWINAQGVWKSLESSYQPAIAWEGKDTQKGLYHNAVNQYVPQEETGTGTSTLHEGLVFDTFEDSTKTDSANTTSSTISDLGDDDSSNYATLNQRVQDGRVGLIGGQTFDATAFDATHGDNDGQTYLGSNTVNDMYYYDRSKDSSPEVLVELGIDPNWYNGVTLSVATGSAQYSQSGTLADKNPNLTTIYNGSLIKVTGTSTDTIPNPIFITIKSPTTFDWFYSATSSSTGVTITPGTAQTLGSTGISITFTATSYNVGDVFRVASWYIQGEGTSPSTRGAKQQFPERSYVIASGTAGAGYIDIIDADTQKLWMRFTEGTGYYLRASANRVPYAVQMLNGKLYFGQKDSNNGVAERVNFDTDSLHLWTGSGKYTYDRSISQRNNASTLLTINTTETLIGHDVNDVAAAVIPNHPTKEVTVSGWGYINGAATDGVSETINLPYKFNSAPNISFSAAGIAASAPTSLSTCVSSFKEKASFLGGGTNTFLGIIKSGDATVLSATSYYCYTWTATGTVSPKQFVAVATGSSGTEGGTTLINETDGSKVDLENGTVAVNHVWSTKVALTSDGDLYNLRPNSTTGNTVLTVYNGVAGAITDSSAIGQYRTGFYYVQLGGAGWSNTGPTILGTAGSTASVKSLEVTQNTSTIDPDSNTIYIGTDVGLTVLQEKQGHGNWGDSYVESNGSVKYYTKDYISEEMIGDIRGMWPFNTASASLVDTSIKGNFLEDENAPTYSVSAVRGTGLTFDGTADHLCSDSDNNAACDVDTDYSFTTGSFSISTWFKHGSVTGTDTIIDRTYTTTPAAGDGFRITMNSTGNIVFGIDDDATSFPSDSVTSSGVYNDDLWHHVVAVKNGTTSISLYIDGQLVGTDTSITANSISDSSTILGVGSDCSVGAACATGANFWDGELDELAITATAITDSQIRNMYQVGYRALQSHGTSLSGSAGTGNDNQELAGDSNNVAVVTPDWNNQYMYVGTNHTTDGALTKIQLNSDTAIKNYDAGDNDPDGGVQILDDDVTTLAVGETLYAVGSAASGVKSMGVDNNGTATSGNFVSKTYTLPKNIGSAVLWASPVLDASDGSNTLTVKASNDGGSNYVTCTLVGTNSNPTVPEKEYSCTFTTADNDLKVKFEFVRGTTKTNTYVVQYGISWLGETGFRVEQADNNNVRLYNYSGETQNLKLNVTGASTTTQANPWTDAGSYLYPTGYEALRIYDGAGSNYLGIAHDGTTANLSFNGTTVLAINSTGDLLPNTNDTQTLGSDTKRWKDIFLGGDTIHIGTSITDEATIAYNTTTNILGFGTDSTTNGDIAFFTDDLYLDKSTGYVGIGDTTPSSLFTVGNGDLFKVNSSGELTIGDGAGTTVTTDITLQNGATIHNNTSGLIIASTSIQTLGGAIYGPSDDGSAALVSTGHMTLHLDNDDDTNSSRLFVYDGEDTILLDINQQTKASDATADFNASLQINTYADDNERLCHSGADGATLSNIIIRDCTVAGEDFAEWALIDRPSEPGELVYTLGPDPNNAKQTLKTISTAPYQLVTGVISTNPYIDVLGDEQYKNIPNARPIALAGRVPVKVSTEGGNIKTGDPLVASSLPGVAMKATKASTIIGFAEEDYDGTTKITPQVLDQERIYNSDLDDRTAYNSDPSIWPQEVGKIMMDFKIAYHDPDIYLTATGDLHISKTGNEYKVEHVERGLIDRIGAYSDLIAANVQAGMLTVNEIVANNIKIDNLDLAEFIKSIVQNQIQSLPISPLAGGNTPPLVGPVTIVSPNLEQDLPTLIVDGEIEATTISARVAKIQEIQAEKITAREIVADTITANTIVGLDAKIASLSAGISESEFETITDRIKSRLASLTGSDANAQDIPAPTEDNSSIDVTVSQWDSVTASASATLVSADIDFVTINTYLAVVGQATITTLDVTNGLYTDSISSKNGLLALGNNTLLIDSVGSVAINGDLTVSGKILANSANLGSLELGSPSSATNSALGQLLAIYDEQGQAVATIDASGSANLASLTTQLITIAAAGNTATNSGLISSTTQSNAAAGESTLISPDIELTIESPYITPNSLVYLTPTTNTDNKVLFVKAKESCITSIVTCTPSFTVGVDAPASSDISFNWWIIELKP